MDEGSSLVGRKSGIGGRGGELGRLAQKKKFNFLKNVNEKKKKKLRI
jgi:hypothetical protein